LANSKIFCKNIYQSHRSDTLKPPNVKNSTDLIEDSQKILGELNPEFEKRSAGPDQLTTISGFDRINKAFSQVSLLKGTVATDRYFCEGP